MLSELFDEWLATVLAVLLAFLIITFLHVVVGELVPKGVALSYAERVALGVSGPVRLFFFVFKPLIWVLQRSTGSRSARSGSTRGRWRARRTPRRS